MVNDRLEIAEIILEGNMTNTCDFTVEYVGWSIMFSWHLGEQIHFQGLGWEVGRNSVIFSLLPLFSKDQL